MEELGANEKLGAGWLVKVHQGMKNKETEGRRTGSYESCRERNMQTNNISIFVLSNMHETHKECCAFTKVCLRVPPGCNFRIVQRLSDRNSFV